MGHNHIPCPDTMEVPQVPLLSKTKKSTILKNTFFFFLGGVGCGGETIKNKTWYYLELGSMGSGYGMK